MLHLWLGAAAAAFFVSGCKRGESSAQRESPPPPLAPAPPAELEPAFRPFPPEQCNVAAARPEVFTVRDAREEYCRLTELIFGRRCLVSNNQVSAEKEASLPSLLSYLHDRQGGFERAARTTQIRDRLASLRGLQTYLYSGQACRLDGDGDIIDLIEAHSLYESYLESSDPLFSRAFTEGRMGCILRRGLLAEEHHHRGRQEHDHTQKPGHAHDLILTPSTLELNSFPAGTRPSDCLILRN